MRHAASHISGKSILAGICIALSLLCGCDYARMYDQDVIKTFKKDVPPMDNRTIPIDDGYQALVMSNPAELQNPLLYSQERAEQGRVAYGYFCIQCHGQKLDGRGTVGQSFVPLPAQLTSKSVLSQPDGLIYSRIRLGFKRHPRLFPTVSADDSWAVIIYMRSSKG